MARFRLTETPATLAVWPFHFQLTYTVALRGNKLITALDVQNTEPAQSFPFTTLLHSYFRVKDGKLQEAAVRGLKDTRFLDKVREGKEFVEEEVEVRFAGEVDRVYQQTQGRVLEIAGVGAKGLRVETTRFEDVVVWNPAAAKAKSMGDLGEDQFPHFVCVEVGTVNKAVDLAAGTSWSASQTLSLL